LLQGQSHLALFYRTLPWDHAAGVLLVEEAGGYAASPLSGKPYSPAAADPGLLIAARQAQWQAARGLLFGD
jgi:fructose-1,6-bisphosphatase/inositol monophosphatase family enzyme